MLISRTAIAQRGTILRSGGFRGSPSELDEMAERELRTEAGLAPARRATGTSRPTQAAPRAAPKAAASPQPPSRARLDIRAQERARVVDVLGCAAAKGREHHAFRLLGTSLEAGAIIAELPHLPKSETGLLDLAAAARAAKEETARAAADARWDRARDRARGNVSPDDDRTVSHDPFARAYAAAAANREARHAD